MPAAAQAAIPGNDPYLSPVTTNDPGTAIPRNTTLQWTIPGDDAAGAIDQATTQANLGVSPATAEATNCTSVAGNDTDYGKTVWYWTFPDISGWYQVTTTGGDAVIRVMPIGAGNVPAFGSSLCYDDPEDTSAEEGFFSAEGGSGARYAFQVGVYNNGTWGAGTHRTRITFFPDRDLDGTFDENDDCPTAVGSSSLGGCPDTDGDGVRNISDGCPTVRGPRALGGCPDSDGDGIVDKNDRCSRESSRGKTDKNANGCPDYKSIPDLRAAITGVIKGNKVTGVKFTRLSFRNKAPKGTKIKIKCKPRRTCKLRKRGSLRKRLRGVSFKRKKTKITITATKKGYVGKVFSLTVTYKRVRGGGRNVILRGPKKRCIAVGKRKSQKCTSKLLLR